MIWLGAVENLRSSHHASVVRDFTDSISLFFSVFKGFPGVALVEFNLGRLTIFI